ncbi:MAG: DNA photolyase [Desulfobacteraceae bacterium 4572_89]|nr:MAG: DNA photolyase [Desulfobacteraceae bacterium 4572_89]
MGQTQNKIISASRRTDIPGWYTPWFLEQIQQGYFTIKNPYNKRVKKVNALPREIHSIVFWSKNFGPFLELQADRILVKKGYNLYFNFTINSTSSLLEPGLPKLETRINQARLLCRRLGPDKISWRFDPICFYRQNNQQIENNMNDFTMIANAMSEMGISRCVTSFYDDYKKIQTRLKRLSLQNKPNHFFVEPKIENKQKLVQQMADYLETKNIQLFLCSEASLFTNRGLFSRIEENSCIDGRLLKKLYGGNPETRKDYGQRSKQGCRCTKSIDIGSYEDHPCFHNCLFCYARTGADIQKH